jgi:hypothetical protein
MSRRRTAYGSIFPKSIPHTDREEKEGENVIKVSYPQKKSNYRNNYGK